MSRKVSKPVEEIKQLTRWDTAGEDFVQIRQATQGVVEMLENFRTSNNEYQWDDKEQGKTTMKTNRGSAEIKRLQVRETLTGSNLAYEDGSVVFKVFQPKTDKDIAVFNQCWEAIDPELAEEIYEKILEVNPQWAPQGE